MLAGCFADLQARPCARFLSGGGIVSAWLHPLRLFHERRVALSTPAEHWGHSAAGAEANRCGMIAIAEKAQQQLCRLLSVE